MEKEDVVLCTYDTLSIIQMVDPMEVTEVMAEAFICVETITIGLFYTLNFNDMSMQSMAEMVEEISVTEPMASINTSMCHAEPLYMMPKQVSMCAMLSTMDKKFYS